MKKKTRIALLRDLREENWPSMEVYADRLAMGLRKLVPEEVEIIEICIPAWSLPDWKLTMPYGRKASLRTLGVYLSRLVKYPIALRGVQADLYHVLDNSYGHLVFFLDASRTLVTSHGGTPRSWRRWNPEGPAMWMFDLAFRGMLKASRILSVSDYARRELLAEAVYPPDHVHVVYHGIDDKFQPLAEDERLRVRRKYLCKTDEFLVLHVGHCSARKNVEAVLRTVALLKQRGLAVRLLQVGGRFTREQVDLIKNLRIDEIVNQLSFVPNDNLPELYAAADIFIFPSLYEGFGIPLIESMGCGTPVVCSDWSLFHEVCGEAACFADPRNSEALAEASERVLLDREFYLSLRQLGLERAKLFTWERTANQTFEVYRYLLQAGK